MTELRRDPREWKTRPEWCAEIQALCSRLNAAGAQPPWTPRRLREYANGKFEVLLGLDALDFDQLLRLRDDLKNKIDAREAERRAALVLAAPAARHALERNASTDEAG